ncbi:Hypothetical protein NGAL_HAMBI1145_06870 [Neorhizobium galegae bv. officinalis]|uniref:Uncharacterized protein n=1 Tax=Neorhizobium galegae bv. officinalis TaxID=323656 RepID=A0A0T7FAF5_NEOGA|nr:hypothetical protein [Neorhizobium galegae]CDZ31919.1 Hypothetical protein NGAL_HAMBI1145_06870 [Neorhizobium galegae bv. officinalis]
MPSSHRPARKLKKPARVTKPLPSDDRKRSTLDDYKVLLQCVPHATEWKPEHLRRTFDYLFSANHESRVSFPARVREHSRFKFTTRKVRSSGMVIARGPWMLHGLTLLDGDPDIIAIAPFPIAIRYISAASDETDTEWKDHIPDVAVLRRNGTVGFIDFMHDVDARRCTKLNRELGLSLEKDCGATYEIMWAGQILSQPRFYNRNLIHSNRPRWGEADLSAVERSILDQSLPATVANLSDAVPLNVLTERWEDQAPEAGHPCAGINVVASSILRLAYVGKVEFDMSRPFGPSTTVSRRVW